MKLSKPLGPINGSVMPLPDPHADPTKVPRFSAPMSFLGLRAFMLAIASLSILLSGSAIGQNVTFNPNCVCGYDAGKDYFPVKLSAQYATGYNIEYFKSYKKITVQGTTGPVVTYAYLCGTPRPEEAIASGASMIQIPIDSVALTSTTFLPLVNYIGRRRSVNFVSASVSNLPSCLRKMAAANDTVASFSLSSSAQQIIDISVRKTNQYPDVVFADTFNFNSARQTTQSKFGNYTQAFLIPQSNEKAPLGALEWLEPVAALFNAENEARYIVSSVVARYNCIKNLVLSQPFPARKKVFWGYWYSSGNGSYYLATCPNYYCQMIVDAGGELITVPSSSAVNQTTALALAQSADVWIYMDGNWNTTSVYGNAPFFTGARATAFGDIDAVKNHEVYDILGDSIFNWFDDRLAEPDVLLMDLVQVLWGNKYISSARSKTFLRNVFNETAADQGPRNPALCTNIDEPLYTEWLSGPCFASGDGEPVGITQVLCTGNAIQTTMAVWTMAFVTVSMAFVGAF